MPRAPVPQAHDGAFLKLVDRAHVKSLFRVILFDRIVAERDSSLCEVLAPRLRVRRILFVRNQFIEPVVCVVDDLGRRPGKILMRPCVRQNMHGKTDGLQAFLFCQIYRLYQKVPVGPADHPVLFLIDVGSFFYIGMQVPGKKVKRGPDSRNILKTQDIRARIHHFEFELGSGRAVRSIDRGEKRSRAAVRKLRAVADGQALFVGISRQICRTVCRIIMKVNLHCLYSFLLVPASAF